MYKLLYAINHRQTEDAITAQLGPDFLVVGAVTYKEAIPEQLRKTGADTLLFRETLAGSANVEGLLKQIRVESPDVRIVVICEKREKKDPFLAKLVGLGIYDIINSNSPRLSEIVSYITSPRTYRDAAQYGIGMPDVPRDMRTANTAQAQQPPQPDPIQDVKKKGAGFLNDIKKGFSALKKPKDGGATQPDQSSSASGTSGHEPVSVPQMDVGLLRDSIREAEARKAQADLDRLIREAVASETAQLKAENTSLKEQLVKIQTDISIAETHASSTVEELDQVRSEKDAVDILLTDTRRKMQQTIDMYEEQLKALHDPTNTPEWYSKQQAMWEEHKGELTRSLEEKTTEAEELQVKCDLMTKQVQDNGAVIADLKERLEHAQNAQLAGAGSDELIRKLRAEASEARSNSVRSEAELEKLRKQLAIAQEGGPDYSYPAVDVPFLPDDAIYMGAEEAPQTIMFLGSKHGVGTTTAAMNLAASLSSRGYKTLLIEANCRYPVCNQFFEFTHVPYGFEEAIDAIAGGDYSAVDRSIIRPHGMRPSQPALYRAYQALPPGLHFMVPSNESLVSHTYDRDPAVTDATIYTLLRYLSKKQQYSHVVLDIPCDDDRLIDCVLNCGYPIDKLCLVMSQDPHSLATAGLQITNLSRTHRSSLVAAGEFIITRFDPNAPISQKKIEQMLHISSSQITKLTEDAVGYLSAAAAGAPYLIHRGRFWNEYEALGLKISPKA